MKTIIVSIIFAMLSMSISAQVLMNTTETKNSISLKVGWDQTISAGINYSHSIKSLINDHSTNIQLEFLSPFATFHKLNNGRLSAGIQSELYRKKHFGLIANIFGTYSWTDDFTANIKGLGIYTSIVPAFHMDNNWILAFELAYRPTIFTNFKFSEASNDTFNDRYPGTRGTDEVPERDGWYSFTNNKFQLGLLINKKIKTNYQVGLKLGFEHFNNDFDILLNGWIGQIPINANINFTIAFN